jgi:hypothetical protein
MVIHKWEPDIYIGFSQALHLQCDISALSILFIPIYQCCVMYSIYPNITVLCIPFIPAYQCCVYHSSQHISIVYTIHPSLSVLCIPFIPTSQCYLFYSTVPPDTSYQLYSQHHIHHQHAVCQLQYIRCTHALTRAQS